MSDEQRSKDYQEQGRPAKAGRDAGQRLGGLQGVGLLPGQLLPIQGVIRERGRSRPQRNQPEKANPEESGGAGDRAGGDRDGHRKAGLGTGSGGQRTDQTRAVRLAHGGTQYLAAQRSADLRTKAEGAGSTAGAKCGPGADRAAGPRPGEIQTGKGSARRDRHRASRLSGGAGHLLRRHNQGRGPTFIDTYSKVAFVKLYDRKNALVAADMLNDRVLPFLEEEGVPLLRILTDRGTEFCGNREHHEYQLYLAVENIDHSKTRAYSPQTNGICERFHRTMQDEFYSIAFRKRLYQSVEQLQADVDDWIREYNEVRPHSGKYCFGKTPMQTFLDAKHLSDEKQLDRLPVGTSSDGFSPRAARAVVA